MFTTNDWDEQSSNDTTISHLIIKPNKYYHCLANRIHKQKHNHINEKKKEEDKGQEILHSITEEELTQVKDHSKTTWSNINIKAVNMNQRPSLNNLIQYQCTVPSESKTLANNQISCTLSFVPSITTDKTDNKNAFIDNKENKTTQKYPHLTIRSRNKL